MSSNFKCFSSFPEEDDSDSWDTREYSKSYSTKSSDSDSFSDSKDIEDKIKKKFRTMTCFPPHVGCCTSIIYYCISPWDFFVGRFFGLW